MNTTITTKMKISRTSHVIFEAIVNPEQMGNYWFSSGSDRVETGKTITWRYEEYQAEGLVHVKEVEKNKKIIFSWGPDGEATLVTIALVELDAKSTVVEVTESGLKEDDPALIQKMLGQKEGWVYMLTCLKAYLENGSNNLRASLVH